MRKNNRKTRFVAHDRSSYRLPAVAHQNYWFGVRH